MMTARVVRAFAHGRQWSIPSGGRLGGARRVVARVTAVSLLAGVLTLVPAAVGFRGATAGAATSPSTAFDAAVLCGGSGSVHGEWPPTATDYYGRIWVPSGARVTWVSSGFLKPTNYWGSPQANDQLDVWLMTADDSTQLAYDRVSLGYSPATYDPIAWSVPAEGWTNPGPNRWVLVRTGAYTGPWNGRIAAANTWTVAVSISGGDGSEGVGCDGLRDDEAAVPNAGMPNACGAQPGAADPVNVVQGNFWQSWTDLAIAGRGVGAAMVRTYSTTHVGVDGPMGWGWSFSYGMTVTAADSVATVRQENGSVVRFAQSGAGWVAPARVNATLVKQADGSWLFERAGATRFVFSPAGQLVSVGDLSGNLSTLAYDAAGDLVSVTEPSGRQVTFTWSAGRIVTAAGPSATLVDGGVPVPVVVSYGYDAAGDLTSVTLPGGAVWTFGYDDAHRMVTVREPRHHTLGAAAPVVENHYDASGRVDWQEDRLDRRTTFVYGAGQTTVTDPAGRSRVYEHTDGICTGLVLDPGPNEARWTYEVDSATLGRTKTTDPTGVETTATFNKRGLPTSVTTPKGTTSITYTANGLPATVTDPVATTTFTWDAGTDRLRSVARPTQPGGPVWSIGISYADPVNPGLPTTVTDPRGKPWGYSYTPAGDLLTATDPLNAVSSWEYNELGWPLRATMPSTGIISYAYEASGAVSSVTDPTGAVQALEHDASGNVTEVHEPVAAAAPAEVTTRVLNAAGELVSVERPDGSTIASEYWPDGALKTQTDAAGADTSYAYDSKGRLASVTDPLGRATSFGYDLAGRLTTRQEPGGSCTVPLTGCVTYGYNAAGELTAVDYSDPPTSDVSFGYDALGRRTSMTDTAGTSTWVWDAIGRLLSHTDPVSGTVGYGYADQGSAATSLTYPGGKTVQRSFDDAGRLASSTDWATGTTSFGYDPNANHTSTDSPATTGVEDSFEVDDANQLTAATLRQGTSVLANLGYTRDPEGMVTATLGTGLPGLTDTFGYTPLDQLASDSSGSYAFDAAGNLTGFPTGKRQRFNAANELCYQAMSNTDPCGLPPSGSSVFEYDDRGNRTARTASSVTHTMVWDQADRMVAASVAPPATGIPVSGDWDGDGIDTLGLYANGIWYLRNTNTAGGADLVVNYGSGGVGYRPVVGDWDGDGDDTIGVYDNGTWYLRNSNTPGPPELTISYGIASYTPLSGDWDGDGDDTIGVYVSGNWHLRNSNTPGSPDVSFAYGVAAYRPVAGDWDGDGDDTVGVYDNGAWFLRNSNTAGSPDISVSYGVASYTPIPGDWNGDGTTTVGLDTLGVYDTSGVWFLRNTNSPGSPDLSIYITQTYRYTYTGDGLRRTKIAPDGTTTTYSWDRSGALPLLLAEAIDGPGTANDRTIRYLYDPMGLPLADITAPTSGAETIRWYHHDQLGSTRALTDASGAVIGTFAWSPFGESAGSTGTATTPFGWAGEYRDAETGFVYLRARYYDPATAQFLTRDPLEAITRSPYGYALNNPVNFADPSGMCPWCVVGGWALIEVGLSLWDAYDAYTTFNDDCAGGGSKLAAGGLFLFGLFAPGGGYGAADEFVDLSTTARRQHILFGDATGGGHLWPGMPGKSPFPPTWSGDRIMHEVSDIATDPAAWANATRSGRNTVLYGTRNGVRIRVVVDSRTGEIVTGVPVNVPRNP